jgi:hypothetical protein
VGRVRFKIRDIMSPVYREIENGVDTRHHYHREMFPSLINDSISSSVVHDDQDAELQVNEENNANAVDAAAIAEAQQNALLTESDREDDDDGESPDLQHATIVQDGAGAGQGMNAEELHNSDREDANNTQFEHGKKLAHPLKLDDAAKVSISSSKKNLDNLS